VTAGRWLAIIIAFVVLLAGGYATWRLSTDRNAHLQREAALKSELTRMRAAIAEFRKQNGRYPHSLDEALQHRVPVDPITHSATTWVVATEDDVRPNADFTTSSGSTETFVIDVHSGAGAPYSEW
jgi:general secretion pathway protein G